MGVSLETRMPLLSVTLYLHSLLMIMNLIATCGLTCVEAFKEAIGDQIRVFACDSSAEAPALQTVDEAFIVLRIEHGGYVDNLLPICNDRPIGLQVPAL